MLVTDRARCAVPLEDAVAQAVAGGVNAVQLRERDLPAGDLLQTAQRLRTITQGQALLLINDRLDIALACDADGVHLPEAGLPPKVVRQVGGRDIMVGRSVHSVAAARDAARSGADYLIVGTVFATASHPGEPASGPEVVREVGRTVDLPLVGIGGITARNVGEVIAAGAIGIAVISAVLAAPNPGDAAAALRAALEDAWAPRVRRQDERPAGA
ncbi:MAG: thiamine phosphate synthase [Chloroflexi bacterium]|nr:thiamine phosphate synthase [Chloroflexota bacterium]